MAISTCVVSGTLKDVSNTASLTATVKAYCTAPFFHSDGTYITGYAVSTTTATDGTFSITLIETTSVSKTLVLEIIYPSSTSSNNKEVYTITVPNTPTATLASLIPTTE